MSRIVAAGAVFAFVLAGIATGSWALVGESVANCAQKGYAVTAVSLTMNFYDVPAGSPGLAR